MAQLVLLTMTLLAFATGCSSIIRTPAQTGTVSIEAISGKLAQKLAEPGAGLSGHKVAILNPADRSVVASGTTDSTGRLDFDVPEGNYVLVGVSDEPQNVQVHAGRTLNFKLVVH